MHAHPHPLQVSHVCVSIPCTHPHPSHSQVQRLLPTNPMKHLSPIRHTSNEGKDCVTSFRPASSLDNSPLLPLTTTPIYTCAYIRFRTLVRKISPRADALCHNGCRSRFHCQPRCLPPPSPPAGSLQAGGKQSLLLCSQSTIPTSYSVVGPSTGVVTFSIRTHLNSFMK